MFKHPNQDSEFIRVLEMLISFSPSLIFSQKILTDAKREKVSVKIDGEITLIYKKPLKIAKIDGAIPAIFLK
ncbi:hypothetical protein [Cytobacillus gottheilii]|uniref:hypothetical protein n=1 Tax=Cytobacillus gottheilii TaxID=859144 RepID=UPI0009BADBCA|nr:hypothetical protein [Cytobacillus gottheilii]